MTDYFYYTTVYGGKLLEEDDFFRLKNRAQRYICGLLHPRSRPGEWCEAARFAVCAAAEALFEEERRQENRKSSGK